MTLKLVALAAVFALAAAPTLAATCTPTGAAPVNKMGPKPAVPANVPQICLAPARSAASVPAECKTSAVVAYHAAVSDWLSGTLAFVQQVKTWQGQADAYSTCIQNNIH